MGKKIIKESTFSLKFVNNETNFFFFKNHLLVLYIYFYPPLPPPPSPVLLFNLWGEKRSFFFYSALKYR